MALIKFKVVNGSDVKSGAATSGKGTTVAEALELVGAPANYQMSVNESPVELSDSLDDLDTNERGEIEITFNSTKIKNA